MRTAIIGVAYGHDLVKMQELVRASTRITHTDPKAEYGALAMALAAHMAATQSTVDPQEYLESLRELLGHDATEFMGLVDKAVESIKSAETTEAFCESLGLGKGVSGYVYHTVPVVIHAWLNHQSDYRKAVLEIIRCGGDTDTTAAILGGIIGASVGKSGIPKEWIDGVMEWPRSVRWMETLAEKLSEADCDGLPVRTPEVTFPAVLARNLFFLIVVLLHGFRRLLPPY
jgi:ADP-ribosylglycohydrolase